MVVKPRPVRTSGRSWCPAVQRMFELQSQLAIVLLVLLFAEQYRDQNIKQLAKLVDMHC